MNVRSQETSASWTPECDRLLARALKAEKALRELVEATEDTLRSHPETSCCAVTRERCEAARELLK